MRERSRSPKPGRLPQGTTSIPPHPPPPPAPVQPVPSAKKRTEPVYSEPEPPVLVPEPLPKRSKPDEDEWHDPTASGSQDSQNHIPQNQHATPSGPLLPTLSDEDDSETDTDASIPYDDAIYVDEQYWTDLSGEARVFSNTASFTTPLVDGQPMTEWQ